jgi:hypothetical protein
VNLNGGSVTDTSGNNADLSVTGLPQAGPQVQIPTSTINLIDNIYEAVLQRMPSTVEVANWLAAEPSVGDAALVSSLINSQDAQQHVDQIIQIIKLATGLMPTTGQMAGWASYEQTGGSLVTIATAFADSIMFQQVFGNGAPVDPGSAVSAPVMQTIIANALGTAATPSQITAWVNTGLSIAEVFVDFALGDQYSAKSSNSNQQYLNVAADAAVEAHGGSGNGGSSVADQTYTDTNFLIDTLVNSAVGVTNTYNFGSSAVLEAGGFSHGNAVVNTTGFNPTLEVLSTAAFTLDSLTYNGNLVLDSTGGAITIVFLTNTASSAVEMVLSPTSISLNGSHSITISSDGDQALATIDGSGSTGALVLGAASTPFAQPNLTIVGGSGALTVVASGDGDNIAELNTSTAGGTLTASGSGDTISTAAGASTITANGAQDLIQLGAVSAGLTISAAQTVHASGANDAISFATTAADGTSVFWGTGASSTVDGGSSSIGIGANDTVNFGNNIGLGSETVVLRGDSAGATTSGGTSTNSISMTTLGNAIHNGGDQIIFNNATHELLASLSNSGQVNVASAASLAQALDLAAANAAASQSGHLIAANTGVVDWFQFSGNTYVVEAINSSGVAASHAALAATDEVVKLLGVVDLSSQALVGHTLTF